MNFVGRTACFLGFLLHFIQDDALHVTAWVPFVATPHRPSRRVLLATSDKDASTPSSSDPLMDTLLHWFQGDFDNYRQVVSDRQAGLLPRESGGHEHIHCCLIPVTPTTRLAAFYFDGTPQAIFRFRFYRLERRTPDSVDTILYTLAPELEQTLRACSDPLQWPELLHAFLAARGEIEPDDEAQWLAAAIQQSYLLLLPNCEVRWSWERDAIQHAYIDHDLDGGLHAVMVHGEAVVDSQMRPGQRILIRDQLSLWPEALWIHDRGLDPASGAYIYGNQRGIPYRLQRVTRGPRREVTDPELAWTLGQDYRTPVEYESRMQVIGGSSRK